MDDEEDDGPWQWPKVVPGLSELDQALRCEICDEFYTGPVQIDCGHCFCSLCVRRFLASKNEKAECPKCRQRVNCNSITPNRALEQLVGIFSASRAPLLQLVQNADASAARSSAAVVNSRSTAARER